MLKYINFVNELCPLITSVMYGHEYEFLKMNKSFSVLNKKELIWMTHIIISELHNLEIRKYKCNNKL